MIAYTGRIMAQQLMNSIPGLLAFGLFVGVFAGLFGLGGGAVIVPILVLVFGLDQKSAQGTSLAMILAPTAAPAIFNYHRDGFVVWRLVWFVTPTMLVGSFVGAEIAKALPQDLLKMIFSVVLTYVAAYLIFSKLDSLPKALLYSTAPVVLMVVLIVVSGVFKKVAG
ncbi:MAG: sulfite exporter TauE/SafE family protein [Planctomycetota bacterium]